MPKRERVPASGTKPIGGFIGLEPFSVSRQPLYPDAVALTSGRACMAALLDHYKDVTHVQLPFYCCDALLEPFVDRGIPLRFYTVGEDLLPLGLEPSGKNGLIVLVDFFGIIGERLSRFGAPLGERVVYDDTHAFHQGRRSRSQWSFNSARKFFGVPDGAFLFAPVPLGPPLEMNTEVSADHLLLRHMGEADSAYPVYLRNEARMTSAYLAPSPVSLGLLARYGREGSATVRRANFQVLHQRLAASNLLDLSLAEGSVPLCYPYLPASRGSVDRSALHRAGLFIPKFWEDVLRRPDPEGHFGREKHWSDQLLPLPIDQRYGPQDMEQMLERLLTVLESQAR